MGTFYLQIPRISNFKLYEARSIGSYRSESPTRIALKNHQHVRLLEYGKSWSWVIDESGVSGWAPTTFLKVSEVKLQNNATFRLSLSIACNLADQSHTMNFEPFEDENGFLFRSFSVAKFDEYASDDTLLIVLENDRSVLSRAELSLKHIRDKMENGIFMEIIEFKLHRNYISSCQILVKLAYDMEEFRNDVKEPIIQSVIEVHNDPVFLQGELNLHHVEVIASSNCLRLEGSLYLTNYRFLFDGTSEYAYFFTIPILCVDYMETNINFLKIHTKDLRTNEYQFSSAADLS